jgi:thiamine kinase-like enzyme
MTNRNYLANALGKRFVVRIPGEGTEEYIDRKADEEAGRLTSDIGVNAPVVYYDPKTGTQITRFIEGCVTMSAEVFKDPGAVRRAAASFRKLHTSGRKLKNDFNEKAVAQEYLDVLKARNAQLPDGYEKVQKQADLIRDVLRATAQETVPCHNDPAPENLVDTGERVYILDWEFAGNNDPFWDLADLSVETAFTEEQDRILLEAYLGRPPRESEYGRIVLYKSLAFLLWTLWGVLQHVNANPRPAYHFASYWDYAMDRFTKCQAIMNSDRFAALLEAVRLRA